MALFGEKVFSCLRRTKQRERTIAPNSPLMALPEVPEQLNVRATVLRSFIIYTPTHVGAQMNNTRYTDAQRKSFGSGYFLSFLLWKYTAPICTIYRTIDSQCYKKCVPNWTEEPFDTATYNLQQLQLQLQLQHQPIPHHYICIDVISLWPGRQIA